MVTGPAHPHQGAGEGDEGFPDALKELTSAGYVNGFLACIIRVGEEAILHPGQTPKQLIARLHADIAAHPAWNALPPDARGRGALTKPAHVAQIVNVQRK